MKTKLIKLIVVIFALFLIAPGCKKSSNDPNVFKNRIISQSGYSNNTLDYKSLIEYSGNKISKITGTDFSRSTNNISTTEITYPSANKINIVMHEYQTSADTWDITLVNNKPSESLYTYNSHSSKTIYNYNSDGKLNKTSVYDYTTTWVLSGETNYTYSSGKLTEISLVYFGTHNYLNKDVISYSGDEVKEIIHSGDASGSGILNEYSKDIYTYSAGKIVKITGYNINSNNSTWTQSGRNSDFSYDTDGNLISSSTSEPYPGGTDTYKDDYVYQDGSGNLLQISEAMGGSENIFYPTPHKKSQNTEKGSNNPSKFRHNRLPILDYLNF
jgi:hypothetical protein